MNALQKRFVFRDDSGTGKPSLVMEVTPNGKVTLSKVSMGTDYGETIAELRPSEFFAAVKLMERE